MPVLPFRVIPQNQREWDQYLRTLEVNPDDGSVTTEKLVDEAVTEPKLADDSVSDRVLRDSSGNSVIGRGNSASGDPADIVIPNGSFLGTRSGVTGPVTLVDGDIPSAIARDAEVTAAIAAAVAALPRPDDAQYILAHKIFGA